MLPSLSTYERTLQTYWNSVQYLTLHFKTHVSILTLHFRCLCLLCKGHHTCNRSFCVRVRDQSSGSQFSLSTMWGPGIKFRQLGSMVASPVTSWAISPAHLFKSLLSSYVCVPSLVKAKWELCKFLSGSKRPQETQGITNLSFEISLCL